MNSLSVDGATAPAVANGTAVNEPASRSARRLELRKSNLAAWERKSPLPKSPCLCARPTARSSDEAHSDTGGPQDTSLKRHTAFIKRLRTALNAADAVQTLTKEVGALSLEKYLEEIVGAAAEGVTKCKTANEAFGAVELVSALHIRFPELFSRPFTTLLLASLRPPNKAAIAALSNEQREKEEMARITRQRTALRILGELEAVGVVRGGDDQADGEQTLAVLRDLVCAEVNRAEVSACCRQGCSGSHRAAGCSFRPSSRSHLPAERAAGRRYLRRTAG